MKLRSRVRRTLAYVAALCLVVGLPLASLLVVMRVTHGGASFELVACPQGEYARGYLDGLAAKPRRR